jgi:hypothetical protein
MMMRAAALCPTLLTAATSVTHAKDGMHVRFSELRQLNNNNSEDYPSPEGKGSKKRSKTKSSKSQSKENKKNSQNKRSKRSKSRDLNLLFSMTNAKAGNEVLMYTRNPTTGEIGFQGVFATGKNAPHYSFQLAHVM